jgi:hypothetical protein
MIVSMGVRDKYVLVKTHMYIRGGLPFWKFNIIEFPKDTVGTAIWKEDGRSTLPIQYNYCKPGSNITQQNTIERKRSYIIFPSGELVYEYKMSNTCTVLENVVLLVMVDEDYTCKWHFNRSHLRLAVGPAIAHERERIAAGLVPSAPAPSAPMATTYQPIPAYIFNRFLDYAIEHKEECPITMEALTRENAAAAPCGHIFTSSAIEQHLQNSATCPTCRAVILPSMIQTYVRA